MDWLQAELRRLESDNDELRRRLEKRESLGDLFSHAPVPMLEKDFSPARQLLDQARDQGVTNLEAYVLANAERFAGTMIVLRANAAALALFEAESVEAVRESILSGVPDNALGDLARQLANMHQGKPVRLRTSIRTLTGRHRHVLLRPSIFPEHAGDWKRVLVAMLDVTEQRETEERFQRMSAQFQAVLDNATAAIAIKDLEGRYLLTNRFMRRLLGLPADKILGKSDFDLFPEEYARDIREKDLEILRTKQSLTYELRSWNPDDSWTLLISKFPLLDERGEVQALCQIAPDITKRRRAEEALYRANMELNGVLQHSPSAIFALDLKGRFLLVNRKMRELLGREEDQLLGRSCRELFPNERGEEFLVNTARVLERLEAVTREFVTEIRGRQRSFEETRFPLYDGDGFVRGVGCISTETTEKKQLMAEAIRAAQLASIGELAAGVAHEINNPITGIINYAQILKDLGSLDGMAESMPDKIIREGERIAGIVRNLLSFARDRKAETEPADLGDIVKASLELSGRLMEKEGVILSLDMAEGLPPLRCRRHELQQVVLNLLSNARHSLNVKYPDAHENKRLDIALRACELCSRPAVRVSIVDHGVGVPAELLDRILEPFFSTKPEGQGTGLGLSISDKIVREHGGVLLVESEEGCWTRVSVTIPVESPRG